MNQDTSHISYDFTAHLTHFCRVLRSHGLLISPQETADVMRALNAVDMMDKGRVYWSLRALLISRRDEIPIYDSLFERFWNFENCHCARISTRMTTSWAAQESFGARRAWR